VGTQKALPAEVLPTHTNRNKLQQQKQLNYNITKTNKLQHNKNKKITTTKQLKYNNL